jgi:hypothetical protein
MNRPLFSEQFLTSAPNKRGVRATLLVFKPKRRPTGEYEVTVEFRLGRARPKRWRCFGDTPLQAILLTLAITVQTADDEMESRGMSLDSDAIWQRLQRLVLIPT